MKIATRDALAGWLDSIMDQCTVIAPREVEGELLYRPVRSSGEIVFDFERTALPPKTYLLPDTQVILEVERRDKHVTLSVPAAGSEQVIFGIRPCDARALRALDGLLLSRAPTDAYYAERRENTTLIGLACPRLWEDCFCTSLGSGPDDSSAVDLMIYEGESEYFLVASTEKGETLLEQLESAEMERAIPASDVTGERVPVQPPEDWPSLFDEVYWQGLARRCLSCHACTYVCPTCRCFDVRDDMAVAGSGHTQIQRLRAWDSCMADAYRRIAGGHNPRPDKAQRLRNRYYCKFCYTPIDFGVVACVGCGRCIAACPVGIDIAEMLDEVAALAKERS